MRHSLALLALIALILSPAASSGQIQPCQPADDGFNVGCCVTPQPNVPAFPTIQSTARYGCIKDCSLEAQFPYSVVVLFQWALCDYAMIDITATPAVAGLPAITTQQLAKYSRTFMEMHPTGGMRQVWRFLLNGYAAYGPASAASLVPCPVPPTVTAGLPVHMIGSIDYICDPFSTAAAPFKVRLNLNHLTGCFSHAPFSTFPLAGPAAHNDRSYHLVAPGNFTFAPVPEPMGPIVAEAVRPSIFSWTPFNYLCRSEEQVVGGQLGTQNRYCYECPVSTLALPQIYANQMLSGAAACLGTTSPFQTVPVPGVLPSGMVTLNLGFWTPTPADPVAMDLFVHIAFLHYTDICTNRGPFHIVTGVSTRSTQTPTLLFGSPTTPGAPGPFSTSMDLGNVLILPIHPPFTLPTTQAYPGWGSLFVSDLVFNLNLP